MPASAPPLPPDVRPLVDGLVARCTFPPPGSPVTCAVSGGPDSSALLVLAVAAGCRARAVHVDHGLRPGSGAEGEVVEALGRRLGVPVERVSAFVVPGPNLEARARHARLGALPSDACTGHTADDQAETVLLNLIRGAGLDGLAAMAPGPRHPILGLRRHETEALCAALGLDVVRDPSNHDPAIRRNRVRHELLPMLDAIAERDVAAVLARQAALLDDDRAVLDDLAAALDPTDCAALSAAPPAIARRAVRSWLRDPLPPPADAIERVLRVARGEARGCELPGGRRVKRTAGRLRVEG